MHNWPNTYLWSPSDEQLKALPFQDKFSTNPPLPDLVTLNETEPSTSIRDARDTCRVLRLRYRDPLRRKTDDEIENQTNCAV